MVLIRSLDWDNTLGKTVRVYRNLNNHKISVQAKQGSKWTVVGHVTELILADVTFHISVKRQQRDRAAQCRSVHAWAQRRLEAQFNSNVEANIDFKYNYKTDDYFVERGTGQKLHNCQYLVVRNNHVFVSADAIRETTPSPKLLKLTLTPFKLKPHNSELNLNLSLGVA